MDAIHVYCTDLGRLSETGCFALLDGTERQRALRISNPGVRQEFARTRALLRLVLSRHIGQPPGSLRLAAGASGKPFLAGHHGLHFSVAHSAGKAMISVAPAPVGADLERVDTSLNCLQIAKSVFSPSELGVLACLERARQAEAFFSIWTRKEAYLKATGDGFSSHPALVSVTSPDGRVEDRSRASSGSTWRSFNLCVSDQFAAAIATRHGNLAVRVSDAGDLVV